MFIKHLTEKQQQGAFSFDFGMVSDVSALNGGVGEVVPRPCANGAGAGCGEAAPLDLTIGHLRTAEPTEQQNVHIDNDFEYDDTIPFITSPPSPLYIPMRRADTLEPVRGWYNVAGAEYKERPMVAKIQRFASGGYEAVVSWIDLEKVGRAMDRQWFDGKPINVKREEREQNENDIVRSRERAKKQVRLRVKNMDCDRLLTLTRRESNPVSFWRMDDWRAAWKRFVKLCARSGSPLHYVAVLEMHEKGNYHLHAAIKGNVNVKLIRRLWLICCGGRGNERGADSLGNVDVSYKRNITGHKRRSGISRYISKYITKQVSAGFNKKRYWSSRTELPAVERYVLGADCVLGALVELCQFLGLDVLVLLNKKRVFIFPDQSGSWFSYDDELAIPPPF
jgi:hypothetical protein